MRGALKILLLLGVLFAIAASTLPWWLGAALAPFARARGVTFARYERLGYARFRLTDVEFSHPSLRFAAHQITLDTPLRWLLHRSLARAEISDWTLEIDAAPAKTNPKSAASSSPHPLHARLRSTTATLRRWLPHLTATNGTIARASQTWRVAQAAWDDGALHLTASTDQLSHLRLAVSERADAFVATAELPTLDARAELRWTAEALRGSGHWHGQPATLDARFVGAAWIPAHAELHAENWDLPAADAKLPPPYERVRGHLRAVWSAGRFTLDLQAAGVPAAGKKAPPFELAAQATGDRRQIVIQTLQLRAPFGRATLSAPLAWSLDAHSSASAAVLAIEADLSQQPWFDAAGTLRGEIRAAPGDKASQGEFQGTVAGFRWGKIAAQSARVRGSWQDTRLQFDEAAATLDAESRLTAHGSLDWKTRELGLTRIEAILAPAWSAPLLPNNAAFEKITGAIELEGPLAAPRHRGELNATGFRVSQLRPTALHAEWCGEGRALSHVAASAQSAAAALQLVGSVDADRATLREFRLERDGRELLRNVAPAEITWTPHLKIAGLRLESAERGLAADLDWSDTPSVFVSAQNVSSSWVADWWNGKILPSQIESLALRGNLRAGVLVGDATLQASTEFEGASWRARLVATAEADGVRISQLEIADAHGPAATATGRVPVQVRWARGPRVEFDSRAPLELDASITPPSPLWELLRRQTPVAVDGGSIVAHLEGSLEQPRGRLQLDAARITRANDSADRSPAEITALSASLRGERDGLRLESLTAQLSGQPVRASGKLPLDAAAWATLLRQPREFDWRHAELQLSAPRVELAALARAFSALPFTAGTLAVEAQVVRGEFTGRAELHGGESRPLPGLGRLLALEAELGLAGRRLDVRTFSARLGGEPVELTGTATLDDRNQPDLDLRLQAKNVPLVRRPGLLVRTDLDLQAKTPERGPTRITGRVELRDALVLADLAAILPGGPRGGSRPPPYFAVTTEPFSRWGLDVRLTGARAVRVRTAVFNGIATPQFQLTGTLGDPRAVGQLTVDEGQVLFPFARFDVQQGAVRLTAADPTQPQLTANAAAKRLGYELRLEAGGTVAAPTLAFSSNPPLESADILLLVTTGQPPKQETAGPSNQQRLTRLGTFLGQGIFQNFGNTEDRLEITSGEQISEAGRETYRAEYKLTDKLSLTGEYDQYDDYNAGLSYRIYTKEGAKREARKK